MIRHRLLNYSFDVLIELYFGLSIIRRSDPLSNNLVCKHCFFFFFFFFQNEAKFGIELGFRRRNPIQSPRLWSLQIQKSNVFRKLKKMFFRNWKKEMVFFSEIKIPKHTLSWYYTTFCNHTFLKSCTSTMFYKCLCLQSYITIVSHSNDTRSILVRTYDVLVKDRNTVKPVYNGHPWDLKKAAVRQRCLIKLRFWLAVEDSNWPLLTGGRCSQVVVKSGLTVDNLAES